MRNVFLCLLLLFGCNKNDWSIPQKECLAVKRSTEITMEYDFSVKTYLPKTSTKIKCIKYSKFLYIKRGDVVYKLVIVQKIEE